MPSADLTRHGAYVMTVCNACRYCEQYCPVFPAMERRLTWSAHNLAYLANLCHNCGECLYSCQYAPPHEFGINVPRTLAETRLQSYATYCWPRFMGALFQHHGLLTSVAFVIGFVVVLLAATSGEANVLGVADADFYAVIPHHVMVTLFGAVGAFVVLALTLAIVRFWRDIEKDAHNGPAFAWSTGLRDALSLRHLHSTGVDCTSAEEARTPWRRRFHHCTFYGFVLCFASTSVAALYHGAFGWQAPYAYTSLPVLLGTAGGIGLMIGPVGLFFLKRARDRSLGDPAQDGLDTGLLLLLFLTSVTGLLLLVLREGPSMGPLLVVHLAIVLALFVTLPYGKFVHGLYRTAALMKYARETSQVEH